MGENAATQRLSIFDADNHLYETRDAFTRYLPERYEGLIRFVEIDGRWTLMIRNKLSQVLPNPTLEKVAPPGKYDDPDNLPKVIVSPPAFFDPQPRLEWMRQTGIDRALLFPTLGLSLEERLADDPLARHALAHAYNRWLHDHWTYAFEEAIFPAPLITLCVVERAIDELEWVLERGARLIYIQPGTVPGYQGRRSMALPEFDPFWERVQDAGILVAMHAGDGGQFRYMSQWEGTEGQDVEYFRQQSRGSLAFADFIGRFDRITSDLIGSLICHGTLTRFPSLRILPVEQGTSWVRPTLRRLEEVYARSRFLFEEHPIEVFRRNLSVHLFRDPDPVELVRLVGAEACVFGSDFPHPEGQADPLSFTDQLQGLDHDEVALIMGGNVHRMMNLA